MNNNLLKINKTNIFTLILLNINNNNNNTFAFRVLSVSRSR